MAKGASIDFPTPSTDYRTFVSYGETDCAGVAYYGEYLHWFERARAQLMRELGLSYAEVERRGIILPVRQAYCRYIKSARFDEEIVVRAGVSKWGRASMTIAYEILGPPDGTILLARGETEHASVGPDGRPVKMPGWLREAFDSGQASQADQTR